MIKYVSCELSHEKTRPYFPSNWLVNTDPYHCLLQSLQNWVVLSSIQPKPTTNRTKVAVRKLLQLGEISKVFTTSFCHKCTFGFYLYWITFLVVFLFWLFLFHFFDSPSFEEIPATQTTCESPCDQIRSFPGQGVGDEDEDPGGPHQNCSKATYRQLHSSMCFFVKQHWITGNLHAWSL